MRHQCNQRNQCLRKTAQRHRSLESLQISIDYVDYTDYVDYSDYADDTSDGSFTEGSNLSESTAVHQVQESISMREDVAEKHQEHEQREPTVINHHQRNHCNQCNQHNHFFFSLLQPHAVDQVEEHAPPATDDTDDGNWNWPEKMALPPFSRSAI